MYSDWVKREDEKYTGYIKEKFGMTAEQAAKKLEGIYKSLGILKRASEKEFDSAKYVYQALCNPEILERYASVMDRYGGTPSMFFGEWRQ